MRNVLTSFKSKVKASGGFLTAKGQYLNRKEFHGLVVGIGAAYAGGPGLLALFYGLAQGGKVVINGLPGHIGDAVKEMGYTTGGFLVVEAVQRVVIGV
jgi:hypothetical protein